MGSGILKTDLLAPSALKVVLDHPRQAAESTLAEVSRQTGVSEPTVVRFCRSVGLGGFRELTRRLTEAMSQPVAYLHQDVTDEDSDTEAMAKVFGEVNPVRWEISETLSPP